MTTALAYPRPVRLPASVKLALLALLAALAVITPRPARASEGEVATDFKRGPFAEFGWRPALVPLRNDAMPAARTHFILGARLSPAVTLGTMGHVTIYFDKDQKVGVGLDAMIQVNVVRGFYLRAGAGAISHVPVAREFTARTPGYGGQVGLGYAFRLGKDRSKANGVALALGADYDLRILADKRRRGIFVLGLTFMFG
ncbi:hypothetical protein [Nannocystis punicea]|uniref:Outer membrane protein beta-barrel domain-containing protein n=1 Tax=Nannocystis punicea TaxID=2995304 RepID=A0ABY7HEM4_9BACT|nr:hypothetical protein [Nannocystis poenicansa]WAS97737.1 hypothetical protein O0S08_16460 [Nannocystis poenicansa]